MTRDNTLNKVHVAATELPQLLSQNTNTRMSDYAAVKFVIIIIIFAHVSCSSIGLEASTKHINERDNKAQNKLAPTVTLDKPKILIKIWPDKVVRWCRDGDFLRPVFAASRVQRISDLHSKFALRPHRVPKYGKHPISDR